MLSFYLAMLEGEGEKEKFTDIYDRYNAKMFSITMSYTGDFHDAEEALQNAFVSVARHIKDVKIDNEQMLRAFLYRIAKNAALDIVEKKKRFDFVSLDEDVNYGTEANALDKIEGDEVISEIIGLISTLSEKIKIVMLLNVVFELPPRKIAKIIDVKLNTVKSRLATGRKVLAVKIKEVHKV